MSSASTGKLKPYLETMFPHTRIDEAVLRHSLGLMKSSAQHFYRERGANVLVALTDDLPFSTKKQSVLLAWAGDGDGVKLFREWMAWVKSRPAIRVACFTPLFDHSRLESFVAREGFRRCGGMFVWERC